MRAFLLVLAVGALGVAACAPRPVVVPLVDATERLDAADGLMRAGCFDCLGEALAEFQDISRIPNLSPSSAARAGSGIVRSATLLTMRERELGTIDHGYRRLALDAASADERLGATFARTLEILDTVGWRVPEVRAVSFDEQTRLSRPARSNREAWLTELEASAGIDPCSAYAWLAFACSAGVASGTQAESLHAPVGAHTDVPLVVFKKAVCPVTSAQGLEALLTADPRFVEVNYYLGLASTLAGRLDDAEMFMRRAYDWHPSWPAVTLARASLALTVEDFAGALRFYDETLALVPGQREARLGRIRSLSYLGHHERAIEAADVVLEGEWDRGEGYFWKAWNLAQLARNDEAWNDIADAWKLWINGDVAKLYGVLALRRLDLDTAQGRFEGGPPPEAG